MPIWLLISLGLQAGGAIRNAVANVKAGNQAKELAEFNARIAELQAKDAVERGVDDEGRFRLGVKAAIGGARAAYAGQNVDVGSGSPVDVQADIAFLGELDALTIRQNAMREAWGYEVEAVGLRMGGAQAQRQGVYGATSGILGASSSLLEARYGWGTYKQQATLHAAPVIPTVGFDGLGPPQSPR